VLAPQPQWYHLLAAADAGLDATVGQLVGQPQHSLAH